MPFDILAAIDSPNDLATPIVGNPADLIDIHKALIARATTLITDRNHPSLYLRAAEIIAALASAWRCHWRDAPGPAPHADTADSAVMAIIRGMHDADARRASPNPHAPSQWLDVADAWRQHIDMHVPKLSTH